LSSYRHYPPSCACKVSLHIPIAARCLHHHTSIPFTALLPNSPNPLFNMTHPLRDFLLSTLTHDAYWPFSSNVFRLLQSSNRGETRCLCSCYSCSHELRDILVMDSLRSVTILVVRAWLLDSTLSLVWLEMEFVGSMLGWRTLFVCSLENIVSVRDDSLGARFCLGSLCNFL